MKKNILSIFALVIMLTANAQNSIEKVLQEIESNNTSLIALQKQVEAQKLGNKTGIYLPNPEVEFGYLWGNPIEIGNQSSLIVTQSIDFPTAYSHRSKISYLQNNNLDILYNSERINVLLRAKQIAIELAFYNALSNDYVNRVTIAKEISDSYDKMYEQGEITKLERNQVNMDLITCINDKRKIDIERKALLNELKTLNGGKDIEFNSIKISESLLPANFDQWYAEVELHNPVLQHLNQQIEISKQQVKLNKALSLPKLSAGYSYEEILGEKLQGIIFGVTIPLWENKNSVKQAKAELLSSEYSLEDNKLQFYNQLYTLYEKSVGLQEAVYQFKKALLSFNSVPMLKKAHEANEISLLDYFIQAEAYYDAYKSMLEIEKEYALTVAELTAVLL